MGDLPTDRSPRRRMATAAGLLAALAPALSSAQSIYWAEGTAKQGATIYRAAADGSETTAILDGPRRLYGLTVDPEGGKLYWSAKTGKEQFAIRRANLDGSGAERVVGDLKLGLGDLAVHPERKKIFWLNWKTNTIHRADLSGANQEVLFKAGQVLAGGIAVDRRGNKVYWLGFPSMRRSDLDGNHVETLGINSIQAQSLAVDPDPLTLYWTGGRAKGQSSAGVRLRRSRLDGDGTSTVVDGLTMPRDLAVGPTGDHLYWVDAEEAKIYRVAADGSGKTALLGDRSGLWAITVGPE